jgi:hypothetical protein
MTVYVSEILARARSRTGKTASTFVSESTDGIPWVDEAHRELYELLVTTYGDEYFMRTANLAVLADAASTSIAQLDVGPGGAVEPTYRLPWKLVRVDVEFDDIRVPMGQFSFSDAVLDDTSHTWERGVDLRYRWSNTSLYWHPRPDAAQTVKVYFVPVVEELSLVGDTIEAVCEPWYEYLVACVALKIAQKERDSEAIQAFMAEKADIRARVIASAPARDIGQPQTIADVRGNEETPGYFYLDRWP